MANKGQNQNQNQDRKFAFVTGASSGIGYELAKQFAQNGYDLLVVADDDGIHKAAKDFEKLGAKAKAVQIDLASKKGTRAFYEEVRKAGRPLDAAALNAGVGVGGPFLENDIDEEINLINLNITSTVYLTKLVLSDMVARGEGKVLITSSIASVSPGPYLAVYHASKAFVQSFITGIREEIRESGVTLTALMPGATDTNFFSRAHMEDTPVAEGKKDSAADVAKDGFDAMIAGKEHIVGGSWKNTATVLMGKITPEAAKARQAGESSKPNSIDDDSH